MSTLSPFETEKFPADSIEVQCYNLANEMQEFIPIANDRNRLGFNLYKYVIGEGDHPSIIVKNAKLKVEGISLQELAVKLEEGLEKIKK